MDKPGISRADMNRRIRKEALREELKSREYLRQIHLLLEKDWPEGKAPELKAKMDGYFRLLGKVLPDLKAVEHSGGVATTQFVMYGVPEAATVDEWQKKLNS